MAKSIDDVEYHKGRISKGMNLEGKYDVYCYCTDCSCVSGPISK